MNRKGSKNEGKGTKRGGGGGGARERPLLLSSASTPSYSSLNARRRRRLFYRPRSYVNRALIDRNEERRGREEGRGWEAAAARAAAGPLGDNGKNVVFLGSLRPPPPSILLPLSPLPPLLLLRFFVFVTPFLCKERTCLRKRKRKEKEREKQERERTS